MKLKQVLLFLATLVTFTISMPALAQKTHGKATFYGRSAHGHRTSDGSRYHKDSLTCAHRTLPFGTLLKVTNKANGKEVVVKVTDRGPHVAGRVVDVSLAAARKLGMLNMGVAPVMVEAVGYQQNIVKPEERNFADNRLLEVKYLDPATGKFYSMSEWTERGEKARQKHMAELRKQQQPRYRILNTKLTAKNTFQTLVTKKKTK